ncbi:hypothetical protein FRB91_006624 [Serendipita sp. 411]|nr:hypothetical protein FRC18_006808 [Serendipita sp. 400]KAG8852313.1 hypothetical protein FRB91_006624 [Serendipita sp. 411]
MPPRVAPPKRSTRRIIEDDDESDELPDDEQYDDDGEEEEQGEEEEEEEIDELEEDDEDDYGYGAPPKASKTGLKIKLNVNATKLKPGGTVVSTPETPPFAMPLSRPKRAAKRRVVEPSDDEIDDQEEEEEEEEADSLATPIAAPSQPARMTARQAALAGGGERIEHVSLEEPPNPRKRKWTEEELALRREEAARKRKLKGAQRQEDEKQMIINRLINKGTGARRGRWANKVAKETKEPTPEADEEVDEAGEPTGAAGEGTEVGENESTSNGEEDPPPQATTQAPTRGGWRGRGRRGRGAKLPPPPVRMHIPVMRWLSGMKDIVIEGPDEPIQVDSIATEESTTTEKAAEVKLKSPSDQESFISFSIPTELLSVTTIEAPNSLPAQKRVPQCAVKGCQQARKYKLVGSADPEIGACGMEHLSRLQGTVAVM